MKQKQKPLVVAVHECLATAEPELQTTAVQFCMQQQRLHGKTTHKSEKDLSPSEGQYMCLIMGTNRNFCSFFNQKYICFYLFKYYLRNDPFLRTQNDDDDACTLS